MSQLDLADAVGFRSHQIVSGLELGRRDVKAWELARIARALHTTLPALMGLESPRIEGRVFWRLTAPTAEQPKYEARLLERLGRYRRVEQLAGAAGHAGPLPRYRLARNDSFARVEQLASRARRDLDLGGRPAMSLAETLEERFGVKIFLDDLGDGESAACVRTEEDAAVLINRNEAPWRQRFSLAHEVFHLVTWDAVLGDLPEGDFPAAWAERLEVLANVFASALLLPGDDLRMELESRFGDCEPSDPGLVDLARSYGVSSEALLWRLRALGLMKQQAVRERLGNSSFRRLDRGTMADHWTHPRPDLPDRLTRLVALAYQAGDLSRPTAARFLEKNPAELYYLDWEDDDGWSGDACSGGHSISHQLSRWSRDSRRGSGGPHLSST